MLRPPCRAASPQAGNRPARRQIDRRNQFLEPAEKMGALGLLGVTVEEAYGRTMMGYAGRISSRWGNQPGFGNLVGCPTGAHPISASQIRREGLRHRGASNTAEAPVAANVRARSPCPNPVHGSDVSLDEDPGRISER